MKYKMLFACLLVCSNLMALENKEITQKRVGAQTLNEQYQTLSADCEVIGGIRMMKLYKMDQLWQIVRDSLKSEQEKTSEFKNLAASQTAEIDHLKSSLRSIEDEKGELTSAVASIKVFGKTISKASFVVWGSIAVLVLIAATIVLFMMYKVAFTNAHEFRLSMELLNKEFEEYKHAAIEKQIKLSRELQNYRNRMAELKSA